MPTTSYSVFDLTNIQDLGSTVHNATDIGTPPMANIQGAIAEPYSSSGSGAFNESSGGSSIYLADFDHASPINPIPVGAQITAVDVRMRGELVANSDISGTFVGNVGSLTANAAGLISITPIPVDTSLASVAVTINESESNTSASASNPPAQAASVDSGGVIVRYTFDFTTNPGGLFPLGYMPYADFITNFANVLFVVNGAAGSVSAQFTFSGGTGISGNWDGAVSAITTLFAMEVTWALPIAWTIDTPTLALPNNIIQISRPDPGLPPADDDQMISVVVINGKKIYPNDPWVVVWLRLLIIIHRPPIDIDGTDDIGVFFIGSNFDGEVSLGTITITTSDLSGIYQLDEDAHTDTLYLRSGTTVTESEVAITAPFLVTYFVDGKDTDIMHYTGTRMRVTGQGTLKQVFQSLDYINTEQFGDLTLRTANNLSPFALANFIDQQASLRLYTDSTEDFMNVSQIIIFSKEIATGYPQ